MTPPRSPPPPAHERPCRRRSRAPAAPACSPASRTRRSPASGRWNSTSCCRRRPGSVPGRRLPARRRLAGGQPAQRRSGVRGARADAVRAARAGRIAVASVDYRLSGEATWPAQLHDAKAAVRWLRARADELGIDPDRIAAWGESAGGHLAELLGLTDDDPALEGDVGITGPSSAVAAVAAWYAPSDVAAVATDLGADPADPTTREALLLGAPAAAVPEPAAQASPITHVYAGLRPSCCCTARQTGSSPACRASGCTPRWSRPGSRPSSTSTRTPTTCGWARPTRRSRHSTAPSTSCGGS